MKSFPSRRMSGCGIDRFATPINKLSPACARSRATWKIASPSNTTFTNFPSVFLSDTRNAQAQCKTSTGLDRRHATPVRGKCQGIRAESRNDCRWKLALNHRLRYLSAMLDIRKLEKLYIPLDRKKRTGTARRFDEATVKLSLFSSKNRIITVDCDANAKATFQCNPQVLWNHHRLKCYEIAWNRHRRHQQATELHSKSDKSLNNCCKCWSTSRKTSRADHHCNEHDCTWYEHYLICLIEIQESKASAGLLRNTAIGARPVALVWFQVRTVSETATIGASITWSSSLTVKEKSRFRPIWLRSQKKGFQ